MHLSQRILPHYTYDDYIQWQGRWELLEGTAISMRPGPWPEHQRLSVVIVSEFELALRGMKPRKCLTYPSVAYMVAGDTIACPDIMIVSGKIEKPFLDFPPLFVCEITAANTELMDRHLKRELYQKQGVKYYLIADPYKQKFDLYELHDNEEYKLSDHDFDKPFLFMLDAGCIISIVLNEIWGNV